MQWITLFVTQVLLLAISEIQTQGGCWSWQCMNDKCVKSNSPKECNTVSTLELLDVCRLTCGPYGAIWPQPTGKVNFSSRIMTVNPDKVSFALHIKNEDDSAKRLMTEMNQLFVRDMKSLCAGSCGTEEGEKALTITIETNSSDTSLTWETNESYSFEVKSDNHSSDVHVSIEAASVFGARHALETLFQLMTSVTRNNTNFLIMVEDASIRDGPVYPHRGLLIDSSRHHLSINTIKRTLDGMGHSKLNVLHWHATDSHSFPLKLPRVPKLAEWGAYSPEKVYTDKDIEDIVNHGKKRGVRVLLEIDSPAHAGNGWQWGPSAGLGNLAVCVNQVFWAVNCYEPPCGQLNPANPNLYEVLKLLYADVVDVLLPGNTVFHVGGDEVIINCWNATDEIVEYMRKEGWGRTTEDFLQLWSQFYQKLLEIIDNIQGHSKSRLIVWSNTLTNPEIIEKYLSKERFIVQTWVAAKENSLITALLEKGYNVIISTESAWNLDHGVSSGWSDSKLYYWGSVYNNRIPLPATGALGGEAPVWGEYIDENTLDGVIWPRAAAVAERLWTNPDSDHVPAQYRFLYHRERLVRLGIRAEAVIPEWCFLNEGGCLGL